MNNERFSCIFSFCKHASIHVDGKYSYASEMPLADCREWKLSAIAPRDRDTWRSGFRSAMHAASQLPGRGPTDVDIAPVPAR